MTTIPKTECSGCEVRDRMIARLAKRIDELEASDLERGDIRQTLLARVVEISKQRRQRN